MVGESAVEAEKGPPPWPEGYPATRVSSVGSESRAISATKMTKGSPDTLNCRASTKKERNASHRAFTWPRIIVSAFAIRPLGVLHGSVTRGCCVLVEKPRIPRLGA